MAAFSLIAKFGLDATGVKAGIRELRRETNEWAERWAKIGLAAGVAAFAALSRSALSLAESLRNNSRALGINVEAFQALGYVARQNGQDQAAMTKALEKTQLGMQKATEGSRTHADALTRLGLSSERLAALPLERKFEALAVAYAQSTDKASAYNAVSELLGERVGPKMISTLQDLAERGFDEAARSASEAGHVMSAETVVALERAEQAITNFKQRATVAVGNILVAFRSEEGLKLLGMQLLATVGKFTLGLIDGFIDAALIAKNTFDSAFLWVTAQFQNGMVSALQAVSGMINKILPDKYQINIGNLESLKVATNDFGLTIQQAIANSTPSKLKDELGAWWDGAIQQQKAVVAALDTVNLGEDADKLRDAGASIQQSIAQGGTTAAQAIEVAADSMAQSVSEAAREMSRSFESVLGIRTGENFAGASDTSLRELVARNRATAHDLRNQASMLGLGSGGAYAANMRAAMLGIEAQNAQKELDMRNRIRSAFAQGGESAVYRAIPEIDPIKLDRLIDQFGRNLTESQRTANTIESIARGLQASRIIPRS